MKIGWINATNRSSGGSAYDKMAQDVIAKYADLEILNALSPTRYTKLTYPKLLYRLSKMRGAKDIWIRQFDSVIAMPHDKISGKCLAIIYHIDMSTKTLLVRMAATLLEKKFYKNLKKVDAFVTISGYWKNHVLEKGYSNVYLIYDPFDMNQFKFTEEEIINFKDKYGLTKRPIIYLGNCQKAKGVVEAYQALKDLDACLVTSGEKRVDIPATNLNLSYRDYLRLLKAASVVVTMSKFKEGWCRTAHEAMLCKTPVVGSGMGGMEELLEGGNQIVCKDFSKLKGNVEYAMEHQELGERGYKYASQEKFTVEYFEKEWVKLIGGMGG